jgi:hypothetical protein
VLHCLNDIRTFPSPSTETSSRKITKAKRPKGQKAGNPLGVCNLQKYVPDMFLLPPKRHFCQPARSFDVALFAHVKFSCTAGLAGLAGLAVSPSSTLRCLDNCTPMIGRLLGELMDWHIVLLPDGLGMRCTSTDLHLTAQYYPMADPR